MTDYEAVQLAALLHDIGKFWQRTGSAPSYTSSCPHSPRHRRFSDCPDLVKDYGYAHSVLTQTFFWIPFRRRFVAQAMRRQPTTVPVEKLRERFEVRRVV